MKKNKDLVMEDKAFVLVAAVTGLILLIPLLGMQFSNEVNWGPEDFTIIGTLLFGAGTAFVLTARQLKSTTHRAIAGLAFLAAVLLVWIQLVVGIFS